MRRLHFISSIQNSIICLGAFTCVMLIGTMSTARAGDSRALNYLEGLKGKTDRYMAPSEIDPRYTIALYANAVTNGANRQRMWVLERDGIGGPWRLSLWDKHFWKKKSKQKKYGLKEGETPPFSWLISTGRYYPGNRFAGPTPSGVYSLDERRGRSHRGWHARGMIHTLFIDYHYSSGRRSGIAFHGTTRWMYRRLGRADSHGCIRMNQHNALALLKRVRGSDGVLTKEMRYGEVPPLLEKRTQANPLRLSP